MTTEAPNLLSRFNALSRQPVARQLRLLLGLAASITIGIGLVQWAMAPDFTPLYGELSPAESGDIIRSLEGSGIQYKVNNRSGVISVPADEARELRLKLASEGLPQNNGNGFDILYKEQQMGISSFMQKARFDRALEHELAASIASLDSVKVARVHLALPKQSAFVRKKNKPAASVIVGLYAGREMTERQLAGIVHLVAFSVPGLEAEQVSVVDNNGKLLSAQNSSDGVSFVGEQFRFTEQIEQNYADRITEILTPILGYGAVRAQVTADVDYITVEKTSESYAPQTSIRSEELVEEITSASTARGIPGTLSNNPPEPAAGDGENGEETTAPPSRSSKREVRNYELDKTISHIRETPGTLKKLSVAVVLDYQDTVNDEGAIERLPLPEAKLVEITALIKEAVGFSEARGDRINVINSSFVAIPEAESMPEESLLEKSWFWRTIKFSLAALAFMVLIFTVLRPLMRASAVPAMNPQLLGAGGGAQGAGPGAQAMDEDRVTLGHQQNLGLPQSAPVYQQQLSMARSMVEGEPERVAHVVKNWVATDG